MGLSRTEPSFRADVFIRLVESLCAFQTSLFNHLTEVQAEYPSSSFRVTSHGFRMYSCLSLEAGSSTDEFFIDVIQGSGYPQ